MIMMLFLTCFSFSIFFAWLASHVKNKGVSILCSIISILIPSILGGLRDEWVGVDVYSIPDMMRARNSDSFFSFIEYKGAIEIGYSLVCYVTMKTFDSVNWCFFVYLLIGVGCFYVGAYKHRDRASLPLMLLLFFVRFYLSSYYLMRQCMAISIIFMGIDNLEHKEYKKFLVYVLVAFTFHASALAALMFCLVLHMFASKNFPYKKITIVIIIILTMFTRPILTVILNLMHFDRYLTYVVAGKKLSSNVGGYTSLLIFHACEYILLIMYPKGAKKLLGDDNVEYYKYNIVLSFIFYQVIRLMFRLAMYFEYINLIAVAALPYIMKDKKIRFLVWAAIIFAYLSHWFLGYIRSELGTRGASLEDFSFII